MGFPCNPTLATSGGPILSGFGQARPINVGNISGNPKLTVFFASPNPLLPHPKIQGHIQGQYFLKTRAPSDSCSPKKSVVPPPWEPHSCLRLTELVCRATFSLGDLPICPNGDQIQFLTCQIWQIQVGEFLEVDVSADKTSVVSADKTSVVSADKTSVVSADISQDMPFQCRM